MSRMQLITQRAQNVIKALNILIILTIFSSISVSLGQSLNDHHSNLNKLIESEKKEKIKLLDEVDLSINWMDKLEDSLFINYSFRYNCKSESVDNLIKKLDIKKARLLIKNTPEFTWEKRKLSSEFKLRKVVSKKGLTYQYSLPIIEKDVAALRIRSFDSYNTNIGDYIYLMEWGINNSWQTICILVIQETFPNYIIK
jgi:hypothetical protein